MNPSTAKPSLIIRAPTWVGDVVLCLPAWARLAEHYELHIVGQGWIVDFLSGFDWRTYKKTATTWQRRAVYRHIMQTQLTSPLAQDLNAVVFPTSFGSAFEMWLAGLKVVGHSHEARRVFLRKSLPMPTAPYASIYQRYWELSDALLGQKQPAPKQIDFKIKPEVERDTLQILTQHGLQSGGYIAVCPFAVGVFDGVSKKWPDFAQWADKMTALGYALVCCPSPSEEAEWQEKYPNIPALKGMGMAQYAAVLKHAMCAVSNDTGPGHLAAAVGVPTISVLDRTVVEMYGAIGPNVSIVQKAGWPSVDEVLQHTLARIKPYAHKSQ